MPIEVDLIAVKEYACTRVPTQNGAVALI